MRIFKKMVTATPSGNVRMSPEAFYEATFEDQHKIDVMKDGRKKYEASLRFADLCTSCNEWYTAYLLYSSVLEKVVAGKKIREEYADLADWAYQGLISCNGCDDECTWECSSDPLDYYREVFEHDDEKQVESTRSINNKLNCQPVL